MHEGKQVRLQGESQVPTALLISSLELGQATKANQVDQGYIVTPLHSFLSIDESKVELSNVIIYQLAEVFESNKRKQNLDGKPCFQKLVLYTCENNKTKPETKKTHTYAIILYVLLNKYKDVFREDLPNGLPPFRELDHMIEVIPTSEPISKISYRLSHSKA